MMVEMVVGSLEETITSNPELLKLQKQNKDLQNQLANKIKTDFID